MTSHRDECIELAKTMLNIHKEDKLPRKVQHMLISAYDMVERAGGILMSRQAIAAIIVAAQESENIRTMTEKKKPVDCVSTKSLDNPIKLI